MRAAGLPPPVLGVHRIASQGLVAKIVAPALPSTSRSAEATCGVVGDQGAPAGASACINSQARTVPLGARVTAPVNGFLLRAWSLARARTRRSASWRRP